MSPRLLLLLVGALSAYDGFLSKELGSSVLNATTRGVSEVFRNVRNECRPRNVPNCCVSQRFVSVSGRLRYYLRRLTNETCRNEPELGRGLRG